MCTFGSRASDSQSRIISCKDRSVQTSLQSPWPFYPLHTEISEFFGKISNNKFWQFFESLESIPSSIKTDKQIHDYSLSKIEETKILSTKSEFSLLRISLSLHNYNPTVQMHNQLAKSELLRCGANVEEIKKCNAFVVVEDKATCHASELDQLLKQTGKGAEIGETFAFDHTYTGENTHKLPVIFLYGKLGAPETWNFHLKLKQMASGNQINYIFRHSFLDLSENPDSQKLYLQGYGVDLTLKNSEYKVVDEKEESRSGDESVDENVPIKGFDFAKLTAQWPSEKASLLSFKANLRKNEFDIAKIKVWELKGVEKKASYQIASSPHPIQMLKEISQNFPSLMHVLSRENIPKDKLKDLERSYIDSDIPAGLLWINDVAENAMTSSAYKIYNTIEKQINGIAAFTNALDIKNSPNLYRLIAPSDSAVSIDLNFESPAVIWVNSVYNTVKAGAQVVRGENFYNAIIVMDPLSYDSLVSIFYSFMMVTNPTTELQPYPIRLGFIFKTTDALGAIFVNDFIDYVASKQPIQHFVNRCMQFLRGGRLSTSYLFNNYIHNWRNIGEVTKFIEKNPNKFQRVNDMNQLLIEKNYFDVPSLVNKHTLLFNGVKAEFNGDDLQPLMRELYYAEKEYLENLLKQEVLSSDMRAIIDATFHSFILEHKGAFDKFESEIATEALYVPLYDKLAKELLRSTNYIVSPLGLDQTCQTTHLIVGDFNNREAFELLKKAILYTQEEKNVLSRVGFIAQRKSNFIDSLNAIISTQDYKQKPSKYWPEINSLLDTFKDSYVSSDEGTYPHTDSFYRSLGLGKDELAIITNGRFIKVSPSFNFKFFDVYEKKRILPALQSIEELKYNVEVDEINSAFLSDKVAQIASFKFLNEFDLPAISVLPPVGFPLFSIDNPDASLSVTALLEPLSLATQKVSSLLLFISEHFDVNLKVFVKAKAGEENIQLKNYYRFVVEPLAFNDDGSMKQNAIANFHMLPQQRLLTMTINEPASWLVSSFDCPYDLDNIILDDLPSYESILHAKFQLDHILVEGSMHEENTNQPTRGLELILGDSVQPHLQDTLVMTNLGYFQLKANPGVWRIQLAKGTQSSKIYQISANIRTPGTDYATHILNSFESSNFPMTVLKREGHQSSTLFESVPVQDNSVTHIFSLASGHLYERFLKIMMLSTRNHTTGPIKFWILSNFLSPSFKKVIPSIAKNFGFDVELVTYKWPSWLRRQTEKQRIIWGYKILFLDVLFPINLTKIIYIDADQTVRADMTELRDMDLRGAPYGYTPFCSGDIKNPLTTGFRFWDSGYWVAHLRGKPYHISALYVVDLNELRRSAHADQLRASYDALTRDPGSLANLDQDLPNYLQDHIPIFSLPPNWLWCETWCTNESLANAKTIDLCNNPLTHEPKLSVAAKIIPEWTTYDNTLKTFEHALKVENEKKEELQSKRENVDL